MRFADSRGRTTMIERHRTAKTRPGSNRNRFAGKGNARSAPALAITEIERRRATRFAFRADNVPLGPCWSRAPTRNRRIVSHEKEKDTSSCEPTNGGNWKLRPTICQVSVFRYPDRERPNTRHGRRWERESSTDNTNERP